MAADVHHPVVHLRGAAAGAAHGNGGRRGVLLFLAAGNDAQQGRKYPALMRVHAAKLRTGGVNAPAVGFVVHAQAGKGIKNGALG